MRLVQCTFEMLVPTVDTAVALFYRHLFELDPSLRLMFPTDMARQREKLVETLATAVRGLESPAEFTALLQTLGQRHVGYGVTPEHYQTMKEALLWMLDQGLGKQFTNEMKLAWTAVYDLLANAMQADSVANF
jgi:hemoglobin-like flavoprotein